MPLAPRPTDPLNPDLMPIPLAPRHYAIVTASLCCAIHAPTLRAQDQTVPEYSLEDLMKVEVVSAARKTQTLLDVPAAVFVLTHDDIERSGAASLPEALRLVPGVQVARLSSGTWAVSVRGSNNRFSNKLQVLIDGRSIYSPLFGGVLWEGEHVPLFDIERIEVIRGPGAAAWGANAVNGVINIITRKAAATQGTMVSLTGGTRERAAGSARYGFTPAPDWAARLWASAERNAVGHTPNPPGIDDVNSSSNAGLRIEQATPGLTRSLNLVAFHSDLDYGLTVPVLGPPYSAAVGSHESYQGASLTFREERTLSAASDLAYQTSFERTTLKIRPFEEVRNKLAAEAQHRVRWLPTHELVWGGAASYSGDRITSAYPLDFSNAETGSTVLSVFAQDEWRLAQWPLTLSYGLRIDRSTLNDRASVQPNLRALWTLRPGQVVWASIARAERLPTRAESSANFTAGVLPPGGGSPLPVEYKFVAGAAGDARNEGLDLFELGYRGEWFSELFVDATAYAGRYRDLRSYRLQTPYLALDPLRYVQPATIDWHGKASVTGAELALDWKLMRDLRTRWSATHIELRADDQTLLPSERAVIEGGTPRDQAGAQLVWQVAPAHELDATVLHVGALPAYAIGAYTRFDARWAWRVTRDVELALVGQNIGSGAHAEFRQSDLASPLTQIRSNWYAKLTMKF